MKVILWKALVLLFLLVTASSAFAEGYVIGEEDVLQISVWGYPELNAQVPVRPDGMISIGLVGDVKTKGLTPAQLKAVLEKELAHFVRTPNVGVVVIAVNSFKVYVFGEGASRSTSSGSGGGVSGTVTLRRDTSLLQLLTQLGSLRDADLSKAYILRAGKKLNVDFERLIGKGDFSQDVALEPDDIIFMPDNFDSRIRVVGAVKAPGIYPYHPGMTALDAILLAGSFTEFASQNAVMIVRKRDKEVEHIEVRLKDVIKDGDVSKNVILKPGDFVSVRTSVF